EKLITMGFLFLGIQQTKTMKLASLYTIWNGTELLDKSIEQIYDHVDVVIIAWQFKSNRGNHSDESFKWVEKNKNNPKFKFIEIEPNLNISTKENERNKLQLRIDLAKKLNCTHY